ncbi:MAG: hypothetical protein HZY75_05270 [Nocardioidaceae bacterium]|nr:MAG: hypothetical protein HZY75_05270 [Nocardioidaceae bacterium]
MTVRERARAIRRAQRVLRILATHPDANPCQLGAARDRLNDCYRLADPAAVWEAVAAIESTAAMVGGMPQSDEAVPPAVVRWISPRGSSSPVKPRRSRRVPKQET